MARGLRQKGGATNALCQILGWHSLNFRVVVARLLKFLHVPRLFFCTEFVRFLGPMAGVEVLKGFGSKRMKVDIENLKQSPDLVTYLRQCVGVPEEAKYVKVMETSEDATEPLERGKSWGELGSPTSLRVLMQSRAVRPEDHARVMTIVRPGPWGLWVRQNSPGHQQLREALQDIHPDAKDENAQPLLHKMIALGASSWLVKELLNFGADCKLTSATGKTAMETAVLSQDSFGPDSIAICKLLTRERPIWKTILLEAVKCDDTDILEALMRTPPNKMEMLSSDWMEVFQSACKQHSTGPFKYLLNHVDISIEPRDIEDLFETSIASGHWSALEAMLELDDGVAPAITTKHLEKAIEKEDNELLKYLLSKINPLMANKYTQKIHQLKIE